MMRSLYSGVSGLRNHQTRMDVIGNNIANVNTTGYKASRTIFQDIFSQNVKTGMANQGVIGGTNPIQIGLGIKLSNIDVLHTNAAFGRTDRETDMMVEGDGFFIVMQTNPQTGEDEKFYTRAGNFVIDSEGYLVNSLGYYVMGYTVPVEMGLVSAGSFPDITNPDDPEYKAPTFGLVTKGTPEMDPNRLERIRVFNPAYQGISWDLIDPADQTDLEPLIEDVLAMREALTIAKDAYDNDPSMLNQIAWEQAQEDYIDAQNALTDALAVALNVDTGEPFPFETVSMPGFGVADNGDVTVIVANRGLTIGRIALATFANPEGLEKAGNSLYRETASSGPVVTTEALADGTGRIMSGGLEMSNVDLASEFTDMIVTQRGFQANSRIITVSDSMIEELVNLKR